MALTAMAAAWLPSAADHRPPAGAAGPQYDLDENISVLPGGRLVKPVHIALATGPIPTAFAVSPSRRFIVAADGGPLPFTLTILQHDSDSPASYRPVFSRVPSGQQCSRPAQWRTGFRGLVFADDSSLYASEGETGRIRLVSLPKLRQHASIDLNTNGYRGSYSTALAHDAKRRLLYALDEANNRLVIIDSIYNRIVASIRIGPLPFALAVSPDGGRVYVTHAGFDAAPGLSNSVAAVDVQDAQAPRVLAFIPSGTPVGGDVVGGSSPSAVLAADDRVYVANAHNDSITVIDANQLRRIGEIPIRIPGLEWLRGVVPVALAYHPRSHWLFVVEAGINAVGVIDTSTKQVLGHMPTERMPTAISISGDIGHVLTYLHLNSNADRPYPRTDIYRDVRRGSICFFGINISSSWLAGRSYEAALRSHTKSVYHWNGFDPAPTAARRLPEAVRHVVLVVREGRSFDEVLGDLQDPAVRGDPHYARFGLNGIASPKRERNGFALKPVSVTPNLHRLATTWAVNDNFHSDAVFDHDGHYWLAGVYPDAWTWLSLSRQHAAGGASIVVAPHQYPEAGTLWHHLQRNGISFLNFGEGLDPRIAAPECLWQNTSRGYPGRDVDVSNRQRAAIFIDEMEQRYKKTGNSLPRLIVVSLPNRFRDMPRAAAGFRYDASYAADADVATGQILEYLSHTPWWRQMTVVVTEADGNGGVDSIYAERVPLVLAGPYIRRGYVSHTNGSFPALLKLVFRLLEIPPLNLFDASAADLARLSQLAALVAHKSFRISEGM